MAIFCQQPRKSIQLNITPTSFPQPLAPPTQLNSKAQAKRARRAPKQINTSALRCQRLFLFPAQFERQRQQSEVCTFRQSVLSLSSSETAQPDLHSERYRLLAIVIPGNSANNKGLTPNSTYVDIKPWPESRTALLRRAHSFLLCSDIHTDGNTDMSSRSKPG